MFPQLCRRILHAWLTVAATVGRAAAWLGVMTLAAPGAWGQPPAVKIMPLGDSLTRGNNDINYPNGDIPGGYRRKLGDLLGGSGTVFDFVGSKSDNAYPGMDPDHEGSRGIRTDEVLSALSGSLSARPDTVLLMLGTNDILQAVPVATAAVNLGNIIEQIHGSLPACRLYVATIPPISGTVNWNGQTPAVMNANANTYNGLVRNLVAQDAAKGRKVKLVDMNASIVPTDPDPSKNFFQTGDGIHPGQAGYDQLGTLWFNALHADGVAADPPVSGLPAAPSNLTATVSSPSRINLSWSDNASNETVYRVRRRIVEGGSWEEIAVLPANTIRYAATGLKTGLNTYAFVVTASNSRGDSAWSNIASSAPVVDRAYLKPAAASSVFNNLSQYGAAKANDGVTSTLWASANGSSQYWQVDLTALHHLQQVRIITRQDTDVAVHRQNFEIRASNDPAFATYTVVGSQGSTPLPFRGTLTSNVTNPAPFRYVRVVKTDGTSFSICLVQVSAAALVAAPVAPVGLAAAAVNSSGVRVSWSGGGSNESGFKLERRTGSGGYAQIVAPSATDTVYQDSGLSAGTPYFYRIRATNESGDSVYSAEVSVTTATTSGYDLWSEVYPDFLALPAADQESAADPNGDGVDNLLAYALGLDPLVRAPLELLPRIEGISPLAPESLVYRFRRNKSAADLTWEVLASSDLASTNWTALNLVGASFADVGGEPGVEEVTVPILPVVGETKRFFRLRVTRSP